MHVIILIILCLALIGNKYITDLDHTDNVQYSYVEKTDTTETNLIQDNWDVTYEIGVSLNRAFVDGKEKYALCYIPEEEYCEYCIVTDSNGNKKKISKYSGVDYKPKDASIGEDFSDKLLVESYDVDGNLRCTSVTNIYWDYNEKRFYSSCFGE